jgi:hypothetical protein
LSLSPEQATINTRPLGALLAGAFCCCCSVGVLTPTGLARTPTGKRPARQTQQQEGGHRQRGQAQGQGGQGLLGNDKGCLQEAVQEPRSAPPGSALPCHCCSCLCACVPVPCHLVRIGPESQASSLPSILMVRPPQYLPRKAFLLHLCVSRIPSSQQPTRSLPQNSIVEEGRRRRRRRIEDLDGWSLFFVVHALSPTHAPLEASSYRQRLVIS